MAPKISDLMVSSSHDCSAFESVAKSAHMINNLLKVCLRVAYRSNMVDIDVEENALSERDLFTKLKREYDAHGDLPSVKEISEAKKQIQATLIRYESKLEYPYRISGTPTRLGDNLATLMFEMDALEYQMLRNLGYGAELEQFVAEKDPFLRFYNAALATGTSALSDRRSPAMYYRITELMKAIQFLAKAWNTIPYSNTLVEFVELLRARSGQLLSFSYSNRIHDHEKLRHQELNESEMRPNGEYQCSPLFLNTVVPIFLDFNDAISVYRKVPTATRQEALLLFGMDNWSELIVRLASWVASTCITMIPDGPADSLRDSLLHMHLQPGEKKDYCRQAGSHGTMKDVSFIIGTNRRATFDDLCKIKQLTFHDVLTVQLPTQITTLTERLRSGYQERVPGGLDADEEPYRPASRSAHESPEFVLCLCEMLHIYCVSKFFGQMSIRNFIILEIAITARETDFLVWKYPMVVQVFHYFQLYYKGRFYRFDSLVLALIAWFKVMERDFNRRIGIDCSLEPWYEELLGNANSRTYTPFELFEPEDRGPVHAESDSEIDPNVPVYRPTSTLRPSRNVSGPSVKSVI